jgi:PilZ domain
VKRQRKSETDRRPVQAYITTQRTYVIRCPHCLRSRQYRVAEIPPDRPNPFAYDCPFCAAPSFVDLVGFRSGLRRRVHLPASFTVAGDNPRVLRLGTVLDISLTGLRLVTEPIKQLAKAESLHVTVVLDDQARSRLKFAAAIRRVSQSGHSMIVAVHFTSLKPEHRYILDRYLHHSPSL